MQTHTENETFESYEVLIEATDKTTGVMDHMASGYFRKWISSLNKWFYKVSFDADYNAPRSLQDCRKLVIKINDRLLHPEKLDQCLLRYTFKVSIVKVTKKVTIDYSSVTVE